MYECMFVEYEGEKLGGEMGVVGFRHQNKATITKK